MRVRVHKNRNLDRAIRPCRCWIVLTPEKRRIATAECVLLRDVEFAGNLNFASGWAFGDLVWCRDSRKYRGEGPLDEERSVALSASPLTGWRRLRFISGRGFGAGNTVEEARRNLISHAPWMVLTPFHDGVWLYSSG